MYRYTEKKNQQANKKQAARRQARQGVKTAARKSAPSAPSRPKNAKSARKMVSKTALLARQVQQKQQKARRMAFLLDRASTLVTLLLATLFLVVLVAGIYVILMNNYFPRQFALTDEKNILLVGASINERAEKLYLVRLDPVASRATVFLLPGSLEVNLVGQYKRYPLSSVSPLVYRYSEDLQEVKASYNFALGTVLDEFYFVPNLGELTTRTDLQTAFKDLTLDDWQRTSEFNRDLLADYFALRASKYFTITPVEDVAKLHAGALTTNTRQLVHCQLRVYNAATANGLARRVSDMLALDGVSVIKLETASEKIEQSTIYYDETQEDCVKLVQLLQDNLPKGVIGVADGGSVARAQRAGAVLYLGEELAN